MQLKTLEKQLKYYEDQRELRIEDALAILNAVYDSFNFDLGVPLTGGLCADKEVFTDRLTSQLYALLAICESHKNLLEEEDLDDTAEQLKDYHDRLRKRTKEKEERKANFEKTLKNIEEIEASIEMLNQKWHQKIQEYTVLEEKEAELCAAIQNTTNEINRLHTEIPKLRDQKKKLEQTVHDLSAQTAKLMDEIAEKALDRDRILWETREKLTELLGDAGEQIKKYGEEISELSAELAEKQREIAENKKEKKRLEDKIGSENDSLQALLREISEKKRFLEQEGEMQTKKKNAEQERDRIQPKYAELSQLFGEIETLEKNNLEKQTAVNEAEKKKETLRKIEQSLRETMTPEWRMEDTAAKNRLKKLYHIAEQLEVDSRCLEEEPFRISEKMKEDIRKMETAGDELSAAMEAYRKEIAEAE